MIDKLLTEHHLECLSLKGGCTGSSESTHVKMPHCWKFMHWFNLYLFFRTSTTKQQQNNSVFFKLIKLLKASYSKRIRKLVVTVFGVTLITTILQTLLKRAHPLIRTWNGRQFFEIYMGTGDCSLRSISEGTTSMTADSG